MESLNFNNRTNIRWKKKPPLRSRSSLLPISFLFLLVSRLLFLSYKHISNSLLCTLRNSPQPQSPHLCTSQKTLAGEKFLWYAPHSGFNNQLSELKNAILMANEDCRTTVWTYGKDGEDGTLDSFQPDEQLKKKKKISYVRKRRDVYQTLRPGSRAELAIVLAFESLFTAPYKGSELYIDIHESPRDQTMQSLIEKISFLPFVPEIMSAGKEFASKTIKSPFMFCHKFKDK
ncbi:unnamed protein product [Camellia sinensis]